MDDPWYRFEGLTETVLPDEPTALGGGHFVPRYGLRVVLPMVADGIW